jgi:hypothetical protein
MSRDMLSTPTLDLFSVMMMMMMMMCVRFAVSPSLQGQWQFSKKKLGFGKL